MVMVVANPILEPGRGPGGLDPPDEPSGDQHGECVVHGLERNGPDFGPGDFRDSLGGDVWPTSDRPQYGEALRRNLNPVLF